MAADSSILFIKNGGGRFESLTKLLEERGYDVRSAAAPGDVAQSMLAGPYRAIIADLCGDAGSFEHGFDGRSLLRTVKVESPGTPVIVIAGLDQDAEKLEAAGAAACFVPPFNLEDVPALLEKLREGERPVDAEPALAEPALAEPVAADAAGPGGAAAGGIPSFCGIIGDSPAIRPVIDLILKVADASSTVLISGESGSGKELVARAIHSNSRRARNPFVVVHCGAIPDSLLESELFGHERGAFTGAYSQKQGLFQSATGGAVFLDEIGEVTPTTQVKLLRVLESGVVRPVGSVRDIQVNVRVIAATNRELRDLVRRGDFREDLFYRLNVFPIRVPPLRERREDIPLLVRFFLDRANDGRAQRISGFDPGAMELLRQYPWPGNIRELENVIERAAILSSGGLISEENLPRELQSAAPRPAGRGIYDMPFKMARDLFQRNYVERLLERCEGNVARAARTAGMSRAYFCEIIRKYGVKAAR